MRPGKEQKGIKVTRRGELELRHGAQALDRIFVNATKARKWAQTAAKKGSTERERVLFQEARFDVREGTSVDQGTSGKDWYPAENPGTESRPLTERLGQKGRAKH